MSAEQARKNAIEKLQSIAEFLIDGHQYVSLEMAMLTVNEVFNAARCLCREEYLCPACRPSDERTREILRGDA